MSLWRQLTRGFRSLTRRAAADQEIMDEVQHYLDEAAAELEAKGLSPEAARRAARLQLGSGTSIREQVRSYGWEHAVGTFFADLRYGARMLRRSAGFSLVAALTLALGIGATTAIFSAVNPILFLSLPYPHASQLVTIWDRFEGRRHPVTFHTYRELAARTNSFEALAVLSPWQPTLTGSAEPERLDGQLVSSSYFRVLGVAPAIGRDFKASDDVPNGPRVVILSLGLWQRRFGGDPAIIGKQISLLDDSGNLKRGNETYTVIGVMPSRFENVLAPGAEVWSPLQDDPGNITSLGTKEWGHNLRMVGRVRPAASLDQSRSELGVITGTPVAGFPRPPWASLKRGLTVDSLQDEVTRGVKPVLLAVLGAVLLVLLIACVNVTNLLLARSAQRGGEFAVRAALGAARTRLIRQLLTESLLLTFVGGALGLLVAELGVQALLALSPPGLPRVGAIAVNGVVFAFAAGITTLIGLTVGLIPAMHASRRNLHLTLQQSSRRTAGSHQSTRRTLVVAEVALALVLLVSAGLFFRSLERLFDVAPGFNSKDLLTMQVQESGHRFADDRARLRFFQNALEAVRRVPGVTTAAFTSQLPLSGDQDEYGMQFEKDAFGGANDVYRYAVTPGYFETMGIPLRRGRLLDARDVAGAPLAVIINESFAKRMFPDGDPIGQRVRVGPQKQWSVIVGIVGDVRQMSLAVNEPDAAYITTAQWESADTVQSLVVRAQGDVLALAPTIKEAIWSVDKDQPIVRVATMDELLSSLAAERRFALILFEAFGIAALALAAIGIYGVLSGSVTERTHEIGIRVALGASPDDILKLIVRQGMTLTVTGSLIGLVGAVAASQALVSLLFGISHLDPITYVGVIILLFVVSAIACWVPASRAAGVDPVVTLRAE